MQDLGSGTRVVCVCVCLCVLGWGGGGVEESAWGVLRHISVDLVLQREGAVSRRWHLQRHRGRCIFVVDRDVWQGF